METRGFPGCCTSTIMYGFGHGMNCDYTNHAAHTKEEALHYIREVCRQRKMMGGANVVMILNNDQKIALSAIDELMEENLGLNDPLSIIYTPWMKSNNHATLVRTYVFQLHPDVSSSVLHMNGVSNE